MKRFVFSKIGFQTRGGGGGVSERVDNAQTTKASLRQTSNQILKQCSTNWCRENALTG